MFPNSWTSKTKETVGKLHIESGLKYLPWKKAHAIKPGKEIKHTGAMKNKMV